MKKIKEIILEDDKGEIERVPVSEILIDEDNTVKVIQINVGDMTSDAIHKYLQRLTDQLAYMKLNNFLLLPITKDGFGSIDIKHIKKD